jgi:predicted membrane protein
MGYKLLGYIVWRGGRWYARRRAREARGTLAVWAVLALVIAGVLAAPRARASRGD